MDRSVWQDTEVGKYVNDTYLPLRVDTADDDYPEYRKAYKVRGTPTILWLDSEGKEIDRIVGFDGDRDKFFQTLQDYAVGKNTLPALKAAFDENPEDVDLNFKMAKKYLMRFEEPEALPFFQKVLELDTEDQKGYREESTYEIAVYESRSNKNVEPLKAFIATNPSEKYLKNAYSNLAFSYQRLKDNENMVATYKEALTKFPENANMMSSFARAIFGSKIENLYEKGLELNEKSVALDSELERSSVYNLITYYQNTDNKAKVVETFESALQKWDTMKNYYASVIAQMKIEDKYDDAITMLEEAIAADPKASNMYFTMHNVYKAKGDMDKALESLKKVVELNPTTEYYKNALEKFEKELQEKQE